MNLLPFPDALTAFLHDAKGPLILHISDTVTASYPYVKRLIDLVKPTLILHTGDMADELKAGRIAQHVHPYEQKVVQLLKILKESGAEVWIVPGNNDLPYSLRDHCPFPILAPGTYREYHGISMRLSHHPIVQEKKARFAIYGHNFSCDPHHPAENPKNGVIYLNGVFEWTVIDASNGKYFQITQKERKPL